VERVQLYPKQNPLFNHNSLAGACLAMEKILPLYVMSPHLLNNEKPDQQRPGFLFIPNQYYRPALLLIT
jgi:hypothetical protein